MSKQISTKTTFVAKFKFDAATYPGATDPKLDGKPVMVLAVKGENPDSCTYSFLSMAALVDTYKAKVTGKDASTTVTSLVMRWMSRSMFPLLPATPWF